MTYLVDPTLGGGGTQDLILSKEGTGRLYYRLGLRYAPTDLNLDPLDMGFVVQRRYEAVDDPADVSPGCRRRLAHQGRGAGAGAAHHGGRQPPLPRGPGRPAARRAGDRQPGAGRLRQHSRRTPAAQTTALRLVVVGTWYEHQNLRDERAEAFTSLLWDGVYEYTYIARATTPGTFVVPPAKAEEMYSPEVFGRSASNTVIVE